jgi:predicted metal-dependent phosphoesterase TrpH
MRIDLHTHTEISDGTDTPTQLVQNAAKAGLDIVAVTDHDTMAAIPEAQQAGHQLGVQVVRGMEISAEYLGRSVHLLGLGIRPDYKPLKRALDEVRESRRGRIPRIVAALNGLGYEISVSDVEKAGLGAATIGRPHVAEALIARGYFETVDQAFIELLDTGKPGYVGHLKLPLGTAIDLVRSGGGAAIWAHVWGRGGSKWFTPDVIADVASSYGLDGLEVWHQLHDPDQRQELEDLARGLDLIPTGGSDYHGTNKVDHDLGVNQTPSDSWERIAARILERDGAAFSTPSA